MRVDTRIVPVQYLGHIDVYLNGEKQAFAVTADDKLGTVQTAIRDNNGFVFDRERGRVSTEWKRGHVVICNHWEMDSRKI